MIPDFNTTIPFILYANCQMVKGATRGTICDLQTGSLFTVPNSLIEIVSKFNKKTFTDVLVDVGEENYENLVTYFHFLLKERLIFFSNHTMLFPQLSLLWEEPLLITNSIIEFSENRPYLFETAILQLNILGCRYLEIRIKEWYNLHSIKTVMDMVEDSTILSVSIIADAKYTIEVEHLLETIDNFKRITSFTVLAGISAQVMYTEINSTPVEFKTQNLSNLCCGKISSDLFLSYIDIFTESLGHNTCLNRKIAIDADGNIKNCPSMKESYGNIKDTTLQEAIDKPGFKKYWDIKKDEVTKCKDCEFRHVCTDCRAYLDNPDDIYSAPLKCGYNPYTCEWEDWSTHPLKQQAIDHYNMRQIL